MIRQIGPAELEAWQADAGRAKPLVVDVREAWEYERCRIEGSLLVPLATLPARLGELPQERDIVLVCHHGHRSQHAAMWLARNGFDKVHNLRGGVEAWACEVEPSMSRY